MSKNRKSRRKSRNRKSAASTEPIAEPSTTQQNHALSEFSPTVAISVTSDPKPNNDLLALNNQKSNLSDNPSAPNESSEKKRKNLHVVKSTNDSLPKRKRNKRKRTTVEEFQYHNGSKSMVDCTGKIEGALYHRTFLIRCITRKNAYIEAKQNCY
jgi:hypothetical protein